MVTFPAKIEGILDIRCHNNGDSILDTVAGPRYLLRHLFHLSKDERHFKKMRT